MARLACFAAVPFRFLNLAESAAVTWVFGRAGNGLSQYTEQDDEQRDGDGLAQSADRGSAPVRLSRRHRDKAQLGGRGEERVSLLVAIAVNAEGYREILGIVEGAKEDNAGWSGFLKHLKSAGSRACS